MQEQKQNYMHRALELAQRGAGHVDPNPMVGCVIVKDGKIIGEGWVVHRGWATALVKVELRDEAGAVLALGEFTFFCVTKDK